MDPPYKDLVNELLVDHMRVTSRYGITREKLATMVKAEAGSYPLRPGLNSKIGLLEGLFLVSGTYSQEAIAAVAPKADLSLFTENSAYGPRVEHQLENLVRGMERDPSSRQHVLYIGQPADLYTMDMPCTISISFIVRMSIMHCTVFMRSSDVIKGLPTDIIQFGILTQVLAHCFDYKPGYVNIAATSQHIYLSDLNKIPVDNAEGKYLVQPMFTGTPRYRFGDFQYWAKSAIKAAPWNNDLPGGIVRNEATHRRK